MNGALAVALGLGFVLGLQHALDPDHMVAVSTIVSEQKSVARSSLVGTFWGMGHTASLLAVGLVVILSRQAIPPRLAEWMELAVAFMLVFLGVRTLRNARREWRIHIHAHEHDGHRHLHLHAHRRNAEHPNAVHASDVHPDDVHPNDETRLPQHQHHHEALRFGWRPFLIGTVHGLAGSGALMLLVLGTIQSALGQVAYIATFGVGSIGGMLIMSALISLPFVLTAARFQHANRFIQLTAGVVSTVFGAFLVCQHVWQHSFAGRPLL